MHNQSTFIAAVGFALSLVGGAASAQPIITSSDPFTSVITPAPGGAWDVEVSQTVVSPAVPPLIHLGGETEGTLLRHVTFTIGTTNVETLIVLNIQDGPLIGLDTVRSVKLAGAGPVELNSCSILGDIGTISDFDEASIVYAEGSIDEVTRIGSIAQVTAGQNIYSISNVEAVSSVFAGEDVQSITSVGAIFGIVAGNNVGVISAVDSIEGVQGGGDLESIVLNPGPPTNSLGVVRFEEGGITGSINVPDGSINSIRCDFIGTSEGPPTTTIFAGETIEEIDLKYQQPLGVTAAINANIIAAEFGTLKTDSFEGLLHADRLIQIDPFAVPDVLEISTCRGNLQVVSEAENEILVSGDLLGSISIGGPVSDNITIAGDVRLNGGIVLDEGLPSGQAISIGGSLEASTELAFGSSAYTPGGVGLAGQVIVNADNGSGSWDGDVRILKDIPANDIVLSGPGYATRSFFLGGGAAGEGPYGLHGEDCLPADGASIGAMVQAATVRHYGPITFASTPVTVWRRTAPWVFGAQWVDVTSDFAFTISGANPRDLIVTPNSGLFDTNFTYKMRPRSALQSVGVAGTPQVEDYEYTFTLFTPMDLSQNGLVDTPDVAEWVAEPVDFNDDEVADGTDLGLLVDEIVN